MANTSKRTLTVFLSSPGGLEGEKQAARRVIDDIGVLEFGSPGDRFAIPVQEV